MFTNLDIIEIKRGLAIIQSTIDKAEKRTKPNQITIGEFILNYDLSQRLINVFKINRIDKSTTLEEFVNTRREKDIRGMHGVGKHLYKEIEELLIGLGYFIKY